MAGIVTVLTDFGLRDGYVAAMKGAMLTRGPELRLVDISHDIAPGDRAEAAYVLLQAAPHFPADTVHLIVVDPGVGSPRRAVVARAGGHSFVAPDNGVLTHVLDLWPVEAVHAIERASLAAPDPSPVFHGRDVFGPAAAFLASGGALVALGSAVDPASLQRLEFPRPQVDQSGASGVIIHIDRFGNLISNVPLAQGTRGHAEVAGRHIELGRTYSDVDEGALIAVRGSSSLLEVACNGASAAELTGASRGDVIVFRVPERS